MNDQRLTLRLKPRPAHIHATSSAVRWKCKPCGATLQLDPNVAGDAKVHCPTCKARLGRANQFRVDPSMVVGVRARLA